jgi:programmed cell death 6-interacting protein
MDSPTLQSGLYDDRKDSLIRTLLEQKQDDLDATAATSVLLTTINKMQSLTANPCRTLQSYGLPGSITALERPSGLPPTLLKKAEEVFVSGGLPKVQHLLQEVVTASQANSSALEQVILILC